MRAVTITDHLFIVGAGFSRHAGLPLTTEFTEKLLDLNGLKEDGPSSLIVPFLRNFVENTFGVGPSSTPEDWPALEDIFTCIDLSANTGHHLGPKYSPSYLRTVRRALIVRIIRVLRRTYTQRKKTPDKNWENLEKLFSNLAHEKCAFLSMNWDTVIEEGLKRTQGISSFDYACNAKFAEKSSGAITAAALTNDKVQVLKPHGSANWLYCDACRQVFWLSPDKTIWIADQLFRNTDWKILYDVTDKKYARPPKPYSCPDCAASALGTRFATFSYRKALDFSMHERSWDSAEQLLRTANNWIFVGYSLPAADYEFKLLLKRVQLSRRIAPSIVLITGGGTSAANETKSSYQKFFGPGVGNIFVEGLDADASHYLQTIGALRPPKPVVRPKRKLG